MKVRIHFAAEDRNSEKSRSRRAIWRLVFVCVAASMVAFVLWKLPGLFEAAAAVLCLASPVLLFKWLCDHGASRLQKVVGPLLLVLILAAVAVAIRCMAV